MFGKYELLSLISRGGMAEIYHARMTGLSGFSKDTALKRILPEHSRNEEFVHLFVNEARVAAKLHHANIVQVFDFGDIDGEYYLAMELVEGTDLRKFLRPSQKKKEAVDIEQAAYIITQIFKGLHYAHTAKDENGASLYIIHRDLSPHNILLSSSGEVKISDFGIAKAAFTTGITAQGFVRGKLGYMSPEQVAGQPLCQKSDIFSVGVIVYELLIGKRLYKGSEGRKMVQQIAKAEPPDPKSYSHLPPELSSFMLSLLERDPRCRPSAGEALRSLNSAGWNVDKSLNLAELVSSSDYLQASPVSAKKEDAIIDNKVNEEPSAPPRETPPGPTSPAKFRGNQNIAEMQTLLLAEKKTKHKPKDIPKYQKLSEQETLLLNLNSESLPAKEKKKTPRSSDKEKKALRILGIPSFRLVLFGITAAALVFFGYGFLYYSRLAPKKEFIDRSSSYPSSLQADVPADISQNDPSWGTLSLPKDQTHYKKILINGFSISTSRYQRLHLPPGEHKIEYQLRKNHQKKQVSIKILPGKNTPFP